MNAQATTPIVIDASVLLAFYLPAEPYKQRALDLLEEATLGNVRFHVPTLARYEILNVLALAVRRVKPEQALTPNEAQEIMRAIQGLPLTEVSVEGWEGRVLEIAQRYQRSAYDAAYLAIAEAHDAPFVTGDKRLFNAVHEAFPRVIWIEHWSPEC